MPFRAPVSDCLFILEKVIGYEKVAEFPRFAAFDMTAAEAILTEAGKLCDTVIAPLRRPSDQHPARLAEGQVICLPAFGPAYRAISDGGWVGMTADPVYGGLGLPAAVATAVTEMMSGACMALQVKVLLSQGQIDALEHHASDAIKAIYLPKLNSGQWSGTMNLTEPQAGSDVGALTTRAVEAGDGTYRISGQKIFITWGDSDLVENVCHLVLARLPGGGAGTRGISLFLVPKFLPDADGNPGARNDLNVISLEHKLGLHGSPTCVMNYAGATGWLVGEPHKGMAAMFTMMNTARLAVAAQGVGGAEAALQQALAYAQDRKQGPTPVEGQGTIIDHADVRRMLTRMRAEVFAARAIVLGCAMAADMATATGQADWRARAALLTPIAKAYGTDVGCSVSDMGIQIHGGMGFIEESGAAQYWRDVRVTPIYEGTNGIQAMDLVGRKLADGGAAVFALLDDMGVTHQGLPEHLAGLSGPVARAAQTLRAATSAILGLSAHDRNAGAVPYLRAFALVLGAHAHLVAAHADPRRVALAGVMIRRILPGHATLLAEALDGAAGLYAVTPDDLMA
jgi:acyl-CoA dehydrogenase